MTSPLTETLLFISDETAPIPVERLADLSDPTPEEMTHIQATWIDLTPQRRHTVIEELGRLAHKRFELLFEQINRMALTDQHTDVRRIAIRNLWECEDPGLVSPLLTILQGDASFDVRAESASALGSFILLGEMQELDDALLTTIEESLLSAAQSEISISLRKNALEALGYSSRPEVAYLIRQAYQSQNDALHIAAIIAIGRSADPSWCEEILEALRHPDPQTRLEAVRAAGELELRQTTEDLIELLQDSLQAIRHAAIWSLGQVGGAQASEILGTLLEDGQESDEEELIQDALDHLTFLEGTRDLLMINLDEDEDLDS